jgi:hypothetical protein
MNPGNTATLDTTPRKQSYPAWRKTPYSNLIRYVPSGAYFGRLKVAGKLIRRSVNSTLTRNASPLFPACSCCRDLAVMMMMGKNRERLVVKGNVTSAYAGLAMAGSLDIFHG